MSQLLIRANGLKKEASTGAKHRRDFPNSILWFIVLTFPIWLYELALLAYEAPYIQIYLILIPASYYVIFARAPYIGVPWILVVIFLAIMEFKKRRTLRRSNLLLH
jgi:hypothetical protein